MGNHNVDGGEGGFEIGKFRGPIEPRTGFDLAAAGKHHPIFDHIQSLNVISLLFRLVLI